MARTWTQPRPTYTGTASVPPLSRRPLNRLRLISLTWRRMPAVGEIATVLVGYALVRLAVVASRTSAMSHADWLWRAERWLHIDLEPSLNQLIAPHQLLSEAADYYSHPVALRGVAPPAPWRSWT